jgi:hypothetical protein
VMFVARQLAARSVTLLDRDACALSRQIAD